MIFSFCFLIYRLNNYRIRQNVIFDPITTLYDGITGRSILIAGNLIGRNASFGMLLYTPRGEIHTFLLGRYFSRQNLIGEWMSKLIGQSHGEQENA